MNGPHRPWRTVALGVLGAVAITLGARISIPVGEVPATLQSLVVALLGFLGSVPVAALATVGYGAAAAAGAPILSGGRGGWDAVVGPSLGFLVGFVVVAVGLAATRRRVRDRGVGGRFLGALLAGVVATGVLLALGCAWAAFGLRFGGDVLWDRLVLPLLPGAGVKIVFAAAVVAVLPRCRQDRADED